MGLHPRAASPLKEVTHVFESKGRDPTSPSPQRIRSLIFSGRPATSSDWTLEATLRALLYGRADGTCKHTRLLPRESSVRSLVGAGDPDDRRDPRGGQKRHRRHLRRLPRPLHLGLAGYRPRPRRCSTGSRQISSTPFRGFRELADMRMYIKRSINAPTRTCYISEERRVTHVFCRDLIMDRPCASFSRSLRGFCRGTSPTIRSPNLEVGLARSTLRRKAGQVPRGLWTRSLRTKGHPQRHLCLKGSRI